MPQPQTRRDQTLPAQQTHATPQPHVVNVAQVPMTAQDVQALRIRLGDLRKELQDAAERRNSIAGRLRQADISARPGYEARLQLLDSRILQIEQEITTAGAQLNAAPAEALIAGTAAMPNPVDIMNRVSNDLVPIVAILSTFVLLPFTIALSRFIWRRSAGPARPALADQAAVQQRFDQLQQAVDTIAVEVERISEGQRFVTKILSERERPAMGAGAAEAVRPMRSAIPSER